MTGTLACVSSREANESAEEGLKLLLGPNFSFVGVLDGRSLARLLPDDESRRLVKKLLLEKALLEEEVGSGDRARKIREQEVAF